MRKGQSVPDLRAALLFGDESAIDERVLEKSHDERPQMVDNLFYLHTIIFYLSLEIFDYIEADAGI